MVKRWMPSASEGEVLRLSMLIFRRENMMAIRLIMPIWFSVYTVIVYSCFILLTLKGYFMLLLLNGFYPQSFISCDPSISPVMGRSYGFLDLIQDRVDRRGGGIPSEGGPEHSYPVPGPLGRILLFPWSFLVGGRVNAQAHFFQLAPLF